MGAGQPMDRMVPDFLVAINTFSKAPIQEIMETLGKVLVSMASHRLEERVVQWRMKPKS